MKQFLTLAFLGFLCITATASAQEFTFIYPEVDEATGSGFDDATPVTSDITGLPSTLGADRRACMEAAAAIWASHLNITVPIEVEVVFSREGGSQTSALLGFAGPVSVYTDFPGAPISNLLFTSAQANQLGGADIDPDNADIEATFNADIDLPNVLGSTSWYYGIDGNPGTDIDFLSTATHELGHGLGFLSLADDDGSLPAGIPDIYSAQLQDTGISPSDFVLMSDTQRASAIVGDNLTWKGPQVVEAWGGPARMYAPNPVQPGSSTSHWDTSLTPNQMMEPFATDPFTDIDLEVPAFGDMLWPMEGGGPVAPVFGEGNFFFRALPARLESNDQPVVALSWVDPEVLEFAKATLVRSVENYPQSLTQGAIIFNGRASKFLDTNVIAGTRYYYTLFIQFANGVTQRTSATVVAGAEAPVILSESFAATGSGGIGSRFDLQFTQITFTPVGPAVNPINGTLGYAGYESYDASIQKNIQDFPVAREDSQGGSVTLPLTDEGSFGFNFGSLKFPFFGRDYTRVFVHANGFISFQSTPTGSGLGTPGIAQHFAIPRISGLFTDLAPSAGGQVWGRSMDDRLVVTFENVPNAGGGGGFSTPQLNNFQMELFLSGQIRFTYKSVTAQTSIVGISDGRGLPQFPQALFPEVTSTLSFVDFSALPAQSSVLHINPISPITVDAGEAVDFNVTTTFTPSLGIPQLSAEWNRDGSPPFADNGNGTGVFHWQTTTADVGATVVRVTARQGNARDYQDVQVIVRSIFIEPVARNLQISTGAPNEDPSESRIVSSDRPLFASYEYFHPEIAADPTAAEGNSFIRWYRNGEFVPSLFGSLTVPASATRAGDVWHFRIIPITKAFIAGDEAISPFVTIADLPIVFSITPAVGLTTGGQVVRIKGERIGSALDIRFGNTPVATKRTISANEVEVTTPLHNAGLVSVSVRTTAGTGSLPAAFRYVTSLDELDKEDINSDGKVDALDIQIVTQAVLADSSDTSLDVNGDGEVDAADVQLVVNRALRR